MHTLIRNAHVDVTKVKHGNNVSASIVINNKFEHHFNTTSRISKHLDMMSPAQLSERLSGGSFFVIDNQVVDFRDSSYDGFVQTDVGVDELMNTIGYTDTPVNRFGRNTRRSQVSDVISKIQLKHNWDTRGFEVKGYADGGQMKSALFFQWNPFVSTINTTFELLRLICENGAVGIAPIFNGKIPLVNRWQEHLNIAADQIQQTITSTVSERMAYMKMERASLHDCSVLMAQLTNRKQLDDIADVEYNLLNNIGRIVNPTKQLEKVYNSSVFDNVKLSKQLPSHLTAIDLYNIVTEVRSHTNEGPKASNHTLDVLSNSLLFGDKFTEFNSSVDRCSIAPKLSAFSNSEEAFFGLVS